MYYLQKSINGGLNWMNVEKFDKENVAAGALGAAKARSKNGEQYRVQPVNFGPKQPRRRTPIALLLGQVAADMWLKGYSEEDIDTHIFYKFKKSLNRGRNNG